MLYASTEQRNAMSQRRPGLPAREGMTDRARVLTVVLDTRPPSLNLQMMPVAGDEIRGCVWLGGFERPKENAAVFGAAEEGFAIGRKGHGPNFVEVAFERTQMRVGVGVPKLNRMIPTSGGEDLGRVEDVIINPNSGRIDFAVISYSGTSTTDTSSTSPSSTTGASIVFRRHFSAGFASRQVPIANRRRW